MLAGNESVRPESDMKITGPDSAGAASAPSAARRAAAPGFSVDGADEASEAAHASQSLGVAGVGSLDALIALQEVDGPVERRRRAVRRAGRILDVLDEVKLAILDGGVSSGALQRLSTAVREERTRIEEPGLGDVLDEIETRAKVELAKIEMGRRAA